MSKKDFVESATSVLKIAKNLKPTIHISYFDLLTAIAFQVFMNQKLEWIVLEKVSFLFIFQPETIS